MRQLVVWFRWNVFTSDVHHLHVCEWLVVIEGLITVERAQTLHMTIFHRIARRLISVLLRGYARLRDRFPVLDRPLGNAAAVLEDGRSVTSSDRQRNTAIRGYVIRELGLVVFVPRVCPGKLSRLLEVMHGSVMRPLQRDHSENAPAFQDRSLELPKFNRIVDGWFRLLAACCRDQCLSSLGSERPTLRSALLMD